jgi:hypothetical protein
MAGVGKPTQWIGSHEYRLLMDKSVRDYSVILMHRHGYELPSF